MVMLKITKENEKEYPQAAMILRWDKYVIHSGQSTDEAVREIEEEGTVLSLRNRHRLKKKAV